MIHPRKLACTALAACLALSCLGACSSLVDGDASQTTAQQNVQPTHSSSIEGTWCLEAGTRTGGGSLTFNSVRDGRNMLVVSGQTAILTLNGTEHPLNVCVNAQDESSCSALLTDESNVTVINATVNATEGESRDTIVLASGYSDQVFIVGIRDDAGLPEAEVEIDDGYWESFNRAV